MNLQDFTKILRVRWLTICVTTVIAILAALLISLLTTPLYQASTRLFVSTSGGSSLAETYQGNRFSQERVKSYAELIMGETLAQRTVDKLGLGMSAQELQSKVTASAKLDTVLINVTILDESPVRARDIANTLSDEFVAMVRELETPEEGASPDARVVVEQRASIPSNPVVPKTSRNVAIGLLFGLILGIGLAVLRDMLDNTVKDKETLEAITHTGTVGSIPLDKNRRSQPAITFESDNTSIAEAFRKLRTNLQFLSVDNPPRVIVVTSSMPHEGKSTTAINIALALAEAEHSVVLVDGDMRRPTLNKYLDMVGPVGFSTVLSGGVELSEALQKTRFPGLTVLTSGAIPPNPSELLGSLAAKKLLSELRSQFDYVVVDSTPLLAVTDAAILAAGADGVLLIARYGHTKRDQLMHAVDSLNSVGAPLLGAVFSMTPSRGSGYSYSYGYYGEYGVQPKLKERIESSPDGLEKGLEANPAVQPSSGQKRRHRT
ncbi:polysaccharide biosynthesis tyrosine autokinase [Mycolicibacterium vanbaalenii]|uniref:polysaccharide biosynthesis tyrosine autokinase n=1 Tax=Mycolicibacterium vanbaalenii TaxID=110539 RepID=UPI001F1B4695|nr:polysaccharide biosynthesis tyrosine autokinase [Mycolicibacterium vanbaalenii]UJL31478.1 polysaccharide biosynthesis tyrosine autokinase [Mycolicibacterium vanbaalenii]WND59660.1 polysaccharide biosynthesis tyrosine autokinase [Mycolicibacterium vanbaalenii]